MRRARFLPGLVLSLLSFSFSAAAADAGRLIDAPAAGAAARAEEPPRAVAARAAELARGWNDLEARARAFARDPAAATLLGGGGVAVDRAALFVAAERALAGGRAGYSLTLVDPSGEAVAWAGRAPTVFPSATPSGAVWSAESVLFFRTFDLELPPGNRGATLIAAWRTARASRGAVLSPRGPFAWNRDGDRWGGLAPDADVPDPARRGRIAGAVFVAGSLVLLAFAFGLAPRSAVAAAAASAFALFWGAAGVFVLAPSALSLDLAEYARDGAVTAGFALAVGAAAAFTRRRPGSRRIVLPATAGVAAFFVGCAWPTPAGLAAAFALGLAGILIASGPSAARASGTAVAAAALLFGPFALGRQQRAVAAVSAEIARARATNATPARAMESAAAELPGDLATAAGRFVGARDQDLGDLAFLLWKRSALARDAPVSGLRLWREGRIVSRFSSGIPLEAEADAPVGGERIPVARRKIALVPRAEFSPGEAPDEAEIEAAAWPRWRPLPAPLRDYRELLLGIESPPPERPPRFSERLLEAVTAGTAALFAALLFTALGAVPVLYATGRRIRLHPSTFRGRITALFTVLVLLPFLAVTVFIRQSLAVRLRRETVVHAQTALETARTVLDDYLFAAGTSPGRRQLIDDDLLGWMARIVGHDLSIYTEGRLFSTSRRELFASGLLPERIDGATLAKIIRDPSGFVVETRVVMRRPFDQVEAALASMPGRLTLGGPAILSIPLLPEQRETGEEIARLSASLTLFTLAVFGLSLLLGARTAFRVTGPIGDLVEGTRAVARGDRPRIPPPEDAELARLVDAFLSMASTLETQREDLARAQRLRAWAEMARIIAHEIKNPLTPIRLSAEHLREVWRRGDPARDRVLEDCVANILTQTEALRGIAAEFSDYARLPEPRMEPIRLLPLVDAVVASYAASPAIRWQIDVADVEAAADARLVARALTNLVANAREALGAAGGTITVRLLRREARWAFRVEDDGPGVDPEAFPRLFEPYFSSKSGGSGLGLAIVRKIAEEHGGDARAFPRTPRGFAVEFDFADAPPLV